MNITLWRPIMDSICSMKENPSTSAKSTSVTIKSNLNCSRGICRANEGLSASVTTPPIASRNSLTTSRNARLSSISRTFINPPAAPDRRSQRILLEIIRNDFKKPYEKVTLRVSQFPVFACSFISAGDQPMKNSDEFLVERSEII